MNSSSFEFIKKAIVMRKCQAYQGQHPSKLSELIVFPEVIVSESGTPRPFEVLKSLGNYFKESLIRSALFHLWQLSARKSIDLKQETSMKEGRSLKSFGVLTEFAKKCGMLLDVREVRTEKQAGKGGLDGLNCVWNCLRRKVTERRFLDLFKIELKEIGGSGEERI